MLTQDSELLKNILRSARADASFRDKRSHLTAAALNSVLENAGVTTAKSVVSNFLSGVQGLSRPQLQVLIRELILREVLPLRDGAIEDASSPSALDPGYAASLGGLARAFGGALGTLEDAKDDLRRWSGQYFLVRRSFFAPGRYCRAHLRLQLDDLTKTMLVVETNRHVPDVAVEASSSAGSRAWKAGPLELIEYYDGILIIENANMVVIVSSERIENGRRRGTARFTMLDRFVRDPATGDVIWAQGRMLISGRESEPVVLFRPARPLSSAEALSSTCLLTRGEVEPTVLAQLDAELRRTSFDQNAT